MRSLWVQIASFGVRPVALLLLWNRWVLFLSRSISTSDSSTLLLKMLSMYLLVKKVSLTSVVSLA